MSLQQLSRRLNRLQECRNAESSLPDYFAPFQLAKEKLSVADRNAIAEVQPISDANRTDEQRAMWERFEQAYESALEETKSPKGWYLTDMYL